METKTAAVPTVSYDDFEPFCTWRCDQGSETLVAHLPEFKREQLKVQISNHGVLKISGERPGGAMKRWRFYREIKLPNDCYINEIHAKFVGGLLTISMPKTSSLVSKEAQAQPTLAQKSQLNQGTNPKINQDQVATKPTITETGSDEKKIESSKNEFEQERSELRLKKLTYMAMNLAVVVAVLSSFNAYIVYKYCRSPS